MTAGILVVPSAWYGQPEADGNLLFSDVPAGDYKIVAWHKSAGFLGKRIHVPENGSVDIQLSIPVAEKNREE